jgi:bifunctional DNA-binding transcriptional regulator/antitoxin component of YhaV-PrlF toxin-antitoxin module|nr:MAG TPA: AbrB family transcriptional regulator-like protein [Caudoviricetes sp.]
MSDVIKVSRKMDKMYRVGLPEDVRKHLNINVGDFVDFIMDTDKDYVTIRKQSIEEKYDEITE